MLKWENADLVTAYATENLKLPAELEKSAYVLFRDTDSGKEFAGLYNPDFKDEDYADGIVAVPLRSTLIDIRTILQGTIVWNVIGSTGDYYFGPLIPNGQNVWENHPVWINIWSSLTGGAPLLCYVENGNQHSASLVGGHMQFTDPNNENTPPGTGIYIIPICNSHNSWHNTGAMRVNANVQAMYLMYR